MRANLEDLAYVLDQSRGAIGVVECVEIIHSNWEPLRYVNNSNIDITIKHEDGQSFDYLHAPLTISKISSSGNLEEGLSITVGDVGVVMPDLIDSFIYDEDIEQPTVSYRAYFINQYDAPFLVARDFDVEVVTRNWQGSTIECVAPGLNDSGNGEVYSPSTDPSLESFY